MGKRKDDEIEVMTKPNSKEIVAIRKKPKVINTHAPTLDDMLSVEFNVPDVSLSAFDTFEEFEKFQKAVLRRANAYFNQNSTYMTKISDRFDMLHIFLEKHPESFAEECGEINRDMIKWELATHMEKCRKMIDRIQEIETDLNLEMHHKW